MNKQERKDVMDTMTEFFNVQDDPKVGIFWYLSEEAELFGVSKINASDLQFNSEGIKTIGTLHEAWWRKQKFRLQKKGKDLGVFINDYNKIPYGRVSQRKDGIFQLMCGNWITDSIEELIKVEFDLQNVPFERCIDIKYTV